MSSKLVLSPVSGLADKPETGTERHYGRWSVLIASFLYAIDLQWKNNVKIPSKGSCKR